MRNAKEDLDVAQLIERLPGVHEALGFGPSTLQIECGGI